MSRVSGFGVPLVVPHPFITVLSCIRGLGGGLGLECRQEAGTLGEVDTKLRVAEEQKRAGNPGQKKEALPAPGILQASRRCKRRGSCKPQWRAQTVRNYFPGGSFGVRIPATAPKGGRAGSGAHCRFPGAATCAPPGSHAPPRRAAGPPASTRAPSAHTLPGTHTDGPAHVRHAPPSPAPRPRPRGAGRSPPIGRTARDARRPAPPLVSHSAEAALAGTSLVRRLAAAAAAAAGARAPAAEGGRARGREGGRSATTPRTAFLLRAAPVSALGGAGVQPIHDHGRQEEPDQVPARS